jgi:hypothetical protein
MGRTDSRDDPNNNSKKHQFIPFYKTDTDAHKR